MNILVCVITLSATTYLGFGFANYYKMRVKIFEDLVLFCNVLESNISYNMTFIKEVISTNITSFKSDLKNVLKKYLAVIEIQNEITIEKLKEKITCSYLEKDELLSVQNFLFNLGRTSVENEIKLITAFKKVFQGYKDDTKEKNKKNYSLSIKLGFLVGLVIVIFIV